MSKLLYRFRSIEKLLEFEELEKQTIYFASPEELNDPMEGFNDLVFVGDKIVWKNLFKHYLMCLEHVNQSLIIVGEEHDTIDENSIPIFQSFDNFPTTMYEELFEKIWKEFFQICGEFIEKISTRTTPIKRDELNLYFRTVHYIALEVLHKNYEEQNFIPKRETVYLQDYKILEGTIKTIDLVEKMIETKEHKDKIDDIFFMRKSMQDDMLFIGNINSNLFIKSPNKNFILIDFINKYINSLEKLIYPKWYTACFMTECNNSSVWGNYADSHKGICLIFNSDDNNINLHGKIGCGSQGVIFGDKNHKFHEINYKDDFIETNFFESISSLPIGQLKSTWYEDENGYLSDIYNKLFENIDEWKDKHWNKFYKNILNKTTDWKYENEYRLILSSILDDNTEKEHRVLKYNFNSLKGLIFGIKTPMEDKIRIIDIIRQKSKENKIDDFEFYQAYYSHKDKNIQHKKISFLKFKNERSML